MFFQGACWKLFKVLDSEIDIKVSSMVGEFYWVTGERGADVCGF
jgi:hypothetical protein